LGLQTLRLASALVLPFNTTHYASELENYLNRVEGLAAASSANINFAPLRAAIRSLLFASLKLDAEKLVAERVLDRQIRKWRKHLERKHGRKHGRLGRFTGESHDALARAPTFINGKPRPRVGRLPAWIKEQLDKTGADRTDPGSDHEVEDQKWPRFPLPLPHKPHGPPPKLIEAAKVVRRINQKLTSFERGFIHQDGIKDREWYKHLGVAPGKWLGYGATTLPALTEAITIEKNDTLANYEVTRLTEAVERIAAVLRA